MKNIGLLILFLVSSFCFAQVSVRGYYRSNGTYVEPHYRSSQNSTPYDNYSYPGNTNPYTGKVASGSPSIYLRRYSSTYPIGVIDGVSVGSIYFFTGCSKGGAISIYIDGVYMGDLSSYFEGSREPKIGDSGTVSITVSVGEHTIVASDANSRWSGSFIVKKGDIKGMRLAER